MITILNFWLLIPNMGNLWGLSQMFFHLTMSHIFLFLCVSKNFDLYPGHGDWYIVETLDSVIVLLSVILFCLQAVYLVELKSLNCLFCNRQQLKSKFTYFSLSWTFLSLPHLQVVQGSSWDLGRVYTLNLDFSSLALSFPEFFPNFPLTVISSNSVFWFFGHRLDRTTGY